MLDIICKLLIIIGIILLVLLLVLLSVIILVLFVPVSYRIFGRKKPEETNVRILVDWMFGLLRVRCCYPKPGNIVAKVLCFTIFDSSREGRRQPDRKQKKGEGANQSEKKVSEPLEDKLAEPQPEKLAFSEIEGISGFREDNSENSTDSFTFFERIWAKCEKIKYTILKIYDNIKNVIANISFYKELFQDAQTQKLLQHGMFRLGRILRSIRPRKIKGNILFGTGSPDTTGYAFGIYSMASAWFGNDICVTPDFTQAVLEGDIYVAGYITVFQLLWHSIIVLLDKRLRLLIHRMKTHKL